MANVFFVILLFYETLTNRSSGTFVTTQCSGGTVCQVFRRSDDDAGISRTSVKQTTVQANPSEQRGKLNMHSRKKACCSLCCITCMWLFLTPQLTIREHYKITDSWGKPQSTSLNTSLQDALQFWGLFLRKMASSYTMGKKCKWFDSNSNKLTN